MRRLKYGNTKCEARGIKFDSKLERDRYLFLSAMEEQGIISGLQLQPEFELEVNGMLMCKYRADAGYLLSSFPVVEDVKGVLTEVFRIKRKLMKALTGVDIHIVTKHNVGVLPHG